jgi:iron complex transport system ATP-binding protein
MSAAGTLALERAHVRHPAADRDALRDVTLAVWPGEILVLVGPNGSGKSTALATLARNLVLRQGTVRLADADVRTMSRRAYARQVAFLPQHPECPEGLLVEDLVASGRTPFHGLLGGGGAPVHGALVLAALRAVDLLDGRRRRMDTLSGGERRRAWLAMTLCQQAPLLLLDEPTAALDLRHQHEVLALLARLNRERGVTIAVVLHDLEHAARIAHRVAVLHRGRVYEVGAPASTLRPEVLRDVFGVEAELTTGDPPRLTVIGPADPARFL